MNDLRRFIKIGDERVNAEEIVSYGVSIDEDDERYLYITVKTSEDIFQYYEEDEDFEIDEKLDELDKLFLMP